MTAFAGMGKYRRCTRVNVAGKTVRKLSSREVAGFQRYIAWLAGMEPLPEPRKRRAIV